MGNIEVIKEANVRKDEQTKSLQESIKNLQTKLHDADEEKASLNQSLQEMKLKLETDSREFQERIHSIESKHSQLIEDLHKENTSETDKIQRKIQMEKDEATQEISYLQE